MKHFYKTKLKAGALQYAIFISITIAMLLGSFILLSHLQSIFNSKSGNRIKAIEQVEMGFGYAFQRGIPYHTNYDIQSSFMDGKTILYKKHWGIFDLLKISSQIGSENFQKIAIMGGFQKQVKGLYLANQHKPLVVVGNTTISGKHFIPDAGVKRGSIGGHSYYGSQLLYGTIENSKKKLSKLTNLKYLKRYYYTWHEEDSLIFDDIYQYNRVIQPFNLNTKVFYEKGAVYLEDKILKGNIIVYSDSIINVGERSSLEDVILIAPKIEVASTVQGNFQAFATQEIIVDRNCMLNYPTALVLIEEEELSLSSIQRHSILIDESSVIKGVVCYLNNQLSTNNRKAQIKIEKESVIQGEVYCDANVELQGSVEGSVYTKGFLANQFGSVYQNHIYNGQILGESLTKNYAGLLLENTSLKVMKWVR